MQIAGGLFLIMLAAGAAAASGKSASLDSPGALKSLNCSACHGANGQSPGDTMPILAGMWPEYFKKAIQDYATGKRVSPEMEPYAKQVLQFGVDDYAAYFGGQKFQPTSVKADPKAVDRGKTAARQCAICHGADGKGDRGKLIPSLAGQPAGYLKNQLMLFKRDQRSPADQQLKAMKALMKSLPDDQFDDLAAYYSSVK
jgi:cytochrome c553